ncbi:Na+/H+ antiporter subunit A [Arthrobacter agilis]|uniref:Na+/H+ antiporter subunit A n=1 Tax=Arthrobacter agilis TaxID=37921 RepID=UPI000B361A66|nr:Na+/H+ antiporter subunit A [Arthrobacter agilis]OUM43117.1 Na+/H+ antiporter subunit A [Arthrobacter agilis]PPB46062.1 Na+/H+ antiporter subunit A [Arthrobacter agilis]TPV25604.1 Na+/H+ antiporter subunit A [Arthrobacter agilis]VDR33373.1 Multiple resistance and pH homeostasis protein A [Arthrobacter agilis]
MLTVLIAMFAVALVAPVLFSRLGRSAFFVLAAAPAAGFLWLLVRLPVVLSSDQGAGPGQPDAPPSVTVPWIPSLQLELAFRLDALAAVLCILILGVGALVLFYCARYFKSDDPDLGAFGAQLLAFAAAMFGLVLADDLILMFIFWELTTILSYLLIGYSRQRLSARRSALQALILTTFGGLAMLVGLVMIGQTAGTYRISEILAGAGALVAEGPLIDIAVALVLVGAITKSALVPFHFWLPGAMAAPTPVSAYLHAAAMVKAGVYLVARFAPGFGETEFWYPVILVLGMATILLGGWRALRQTDLKLVLAYGTVSQLGFLVMVVGLGGRDGAIAGLGLLLAHGFFKATLFLVVGVIDHHAGTRDLRVLSGVGAASPVLFAVALVAAGSMAGVPPLLGFVAKESVYEAFVHRAEDGLIGTLLLGGVVLGSVLTFAYSARFVRGCLRTEAGIPRTDFTPVRTSFLVAPAVLAAASVLFGVWPVPLDAVAQPYASLFPGDSAPPHLALWHGFTPALLLSAVTLAAGAALYLLRVPFERVQGRLPRVREAEVVYRSIIGVLDDVAVWITGRTQRGSLAFYLFIILSTAVITPLAALIIFEAPRPDAFRVADSPAQIIAAAVILVGILAALRSTKRFMAVLMVGITGYGMAIIYALHGAPDLALTQMLVETIVLVAFVLALRSLPARLWNREGSRHRLLRAGLGIAFGSIMAVIAMSAMASRNAAPISLAYPKLAYDDGGGANAVNVLLVDIRAWDTFGEITVLAIAATGIASLIFIRSRGDDRRRADGVEDGSVDRGQEPLDAGGRAGAARELAARFANVSRDPWLVAGRTLAPERRSIIFEVITRLLFHTMILLSVYLLIAGHNLPGGGFAGGLTAGLALAIRYLAGGRFELAEASPVSAGTLLGVGLAIVTLTAATPLFLGGAVLESYILEFWLPVFGDVKFVTSTIFDIGVYIIVVGLVLDVLRSLGSEIDQRSEDQQPVEEDLGADALVPPTVEGVQP